MQIFNGKSKAFKIVCQHRIYACTCIYQLPSNQCDLRPNQNSFNLVFCRCLFDMNGENVAS